MLGMQTQLDKIRSDAAECLLLSNLAPSDKREMFAKIARHLNSLATQFEKTMAADGANLIGGKPLQLENIRSDAAECLSLGNLAESDSNREFFSKIAEHLNSLIHPLDNVVTGKGENNVCTEHGPAQQEIPGLEVALNQTFGSNELPIANRPHAGRPHRMLPWLLVIVGAPIIGVLIWTLGHVDGHVSGSSNRSSVVQQRGVARTKNLASTRHDVEKKPILSSENYNEAVPQTAETPAAEGQQVRQTTASLTDDPSAVGRTSETKMASSSNTDDEVVKLRNTAEVKNSDLQQERQKSASLADDLASAHRELEVKAALSTSATDEVVQLKNASKATAAELQQEREKTASLTTDLASARQESRAATELKKTVQETAVELQQEQQKTLALTNELASANHELQTKAALSSKTSDEAIQIKKAAEAAAAELQRERQKTAALTKDLNSATRALEKRRRLSRRSSERLRQARR